MLSMQMRSNQPTKQLVYVTFLNGVVLAPKDNPRKITLLMFLAVTLELAVREGCNFSFIWIVNFFFLPILLFNGNAEPSKFWILHLGTSKQVLNLNKRTYSSKFDMKLFLNNVQCLFHALYVLQTSKVILSPL